MFSSAGYSSKDDRELTSAITLVLVGRTGNGKSATGNSIIGSDVFKSKLSSSGITTASKLKTTVLGDGRVLNVIDTPGLFGSSIDSESIEKEFARCIDMATVGIHAFLVVFSVRNRFSDEEKAVINSLVDFYGSRIYDYMIVVFTGADELEEDGTSFEQFLNDYPESMQEILSRCEFRCVLFDNRTKNEFKKSRQVQELLSCVKKVSQKTYTNEVFQLKLYESKFVKFELKHWKNFEEAFNKMREVVEKAEQSAGCVVM